jgi:hypothetical protein
LVCTGKTPDLEVIAEPRLGENFRLVIPTAGHEADYFYSRDQKVSHVEAMPDGVLCTYDSLSNHQETLPISVAYRARVVDQQVLFSIEVKNPTDRRLAEVMYGVIGGQGIGDRRDTESLIPGENTNDAPGLFTRFNGGGYGGDNLGIRYDSATFTYPGSRSMGWMDVYNPKADIGYYYANQDQETRLTLLDSKDASVSYMHSPGSTFSKCKESNGSTYLRLGGSHLLFRL